MSIYINIATILSKATNASDYFHLADHVLKLRYSKVVKKCVQIKMEPFEKLQKSAKCGADTCNGDSAQLCRIVECFIY